MVRTYSFLLLRGESVLKSKEKAGYGRKKIWF